MILCVGLVLSVTAFTRAWRGEHERMKAGFVGAAEDSVSALKQIIEFNLHEVEALGAYYAASVEVERSEFREFVKPFLAHNPGIQALEWIPRVPHSRRAACEEAARREGLADFQITERKRQGQMTRAADREEYFPVYFVEPYEGNEVAVGFDVASNPARKRTLERAAESGLMAATSRITLVQEIGRQYGFLVFLPVYRKGQPTDSPEARRNSLEGFVLGVFRAGDMARRALAYLKPQGVDVYLLDRSAPEGARFLDFQPARTRSEPVQPMRDDDAGLRAGLHHAAMLDVAGRKWLVVCRPTPAYFASGRTWELWLILCGGLVLTALVTGGFLSAIGRAERIERLVRERTFELDETNEKLKRAIAVRERAEKALRTAHDELEMRVAERTEQLSASNAHLEEHMEEVKRFNRLAVGRELRMAELKQEINGLLAELDREEKYRTSSVGRTEPRS
ncbi:MAG: CHASE domain-containing protein [Planctomycetota bacterium]